MGQQQIRVSFSVGTKLLISIVLLLLIVILFLNISTIFLFREDKRAYIYQTQSTEALLTGREFLITTQHALDTLRTYLAAVDPRTPLGESQKNILQSVINNQTEIFSAGIYLTKVDSGDVTLYSRTSKEKELEAIGIDLDSYAISTPWMVALLPKILKDSFAFVNMSQLGGPPILGIIFADLKLKDSPSGMPIAIGLVSLKGFGADLNDMQLTIATRSGWILYDTDSTEFFSQKNISDYPLFKTAVSSQVMNGAQEFDMNGSHFLGSYVQPGLDLVILTKTDWRKAMQATYMIIEKFILLGSMAVGAAIIFAILFSKTLTAPIERLYDATKEIAKGNFLLKLEEKGTDEIGALSSSFNTMSKKIAELIQESVHRVQLENELAIASTVQQTLIPPSEFKNPKIHIFSHYQSASQCGGDWWGFFGVGNKIALMIADATGHGFPSALITASARSCFSMMHKLAQEDPDFSFSPSAMLAFANRVIYDASLGKIMMTFFVGVLDFETNQISYSSAGHNPPWLFKLENGKYSLKSLTAVGQRLGEVREAPPFEEKTLPLDPNDIIFMYTDGLTEGKDRAGEMYGKKRARKLVEAQLQSGPEAVVKNLMQDFLKHNQQKPLDDDVTIAVTQILQGSPGPLHA